MVFSSLTFLFRFLPVFLILYYAVPVKFKNFVLLAGSLFFYAYGEPKYILLLLLSVIVNYFVALLINKSENNVLQRRLWLVLGLFYDIGMLFFFKYINFIIGNVNFIGENLFHSGSLTLLSLALPLGISFYTFQIVSYVIDVYKGEVQVERSVFHLGLYLCMFPQLISGPIVKYTDIKGQLINRTFSLKNIEKGLKTFTFGLGLKVLLADRIGILWNDIQTIGFESISTPLAWLGIFGYSLQLYFDFYGYSLMAVGTGQMLGFTLPENFSDPYISKSVTEFWRRWHISLGRWFRDYVYIPLGGNRNGTAKLIINLLIVWMLTGLWHGADWNFILWGLSLFLFICIEKLFLKKYLDQSKLLSRLYLLTVIPLTWMLFAIANLADIGTYFGRLFSFIPGICVNSHDIIKYLNLYKWYFVFGIFFCMPFARSWLKKYDSSIISNVLLFIVFWYSVYQLSIGINNPFLYFKF